MSISLQVWIRPNTVAAIWPPLDEPGNTLFLRPIVSGRMARSPGRAVGAHEQVDVGLNQARILVHRRLAEPEHRPDVRPSQE